MLGDHAANVGGDGTVPTTKFSEGVPVAEGRVIGESRSELAHVTTSAKNGHIRVSGTEYMGRVSLPSGAIPMEGPAGSVLFELPLNPMIWDGARLKAMAGLYEQFRIVAMEIEFVSAMPTTTPGMLVGYAVSDIDDNASVYYGDAALRAAYARPGSLGFPVWKSCAFTVQNTLLEWYYTNSSGYDPMGSQPGMFYLVAGSDYLAPAGANATLQFGAIRVHYEVEFKVPSIEDPADFEFNAKGSKLSVKPSVLAGNPLVFSDLGLPIEFRKQGVIACGCISALDTGSAPNWNEVQDARSGRVWSLRPGALLFFRWKRSSASAEFYAYPTLAAAMTDDDNALIAQTSVPASPGTAGIVLGITRGYRIAS